MAVTRARAGGWRSRLATVLVVGALLVTLAPPGVASPAAPHLDEWEFLNLVNRERRALGLGPMAMVAGARDVARAWSGRMATENNLRHNPDLTAQMAARYPDWRRVAENVGQGSSVPGLHQAFMASAGHRRNVVGDYDYVGIGVRWAGSALWVTFNFLKNGTPVPWFTRAPVTRIGAAGDPDTSVLVSRRRPADSAAAVVVARSDVFADALAGAPLAGVNEGPILLSPPGGVPDNVVDEAVRVLRPGGRVVLLGGPSALSTEVDAAFARRGLPVERIAGGDRFETATLTAARVTPAPSEVFVASGLQFPDAVVVGAVAAARRQPIVLVAPGAVPPATAAYLEAHRNTSRIVVGGPLAVGDAVARAVSMTYRVAGADRFATSVAIANRFFGTSNRVALASGLRFADALIAAPEAARNGMAVVLTASPPSNATYDYVGANAGRWVDALVVGSPAAVSDATVITLFS